MTDILQYLLIGLAVLGLLSVVLEEIIHINKAQSVLFFGALAWVLLFVFSSSNPDPAEHQRVIDGLEENIGEIASLWLFLLAAMTFVVYLNKKGMIESLIYKVLPSQISERKLLFLTGLFSFVFSSLADNITATLISIALILSLNLPTPKTLRFATLVVFAVNSGGVAMITGDVTTLMIFLEGKVSITNLLLLSMPSLLAVLLLATILSAPLTDTAIIQRKTHVLQRVDSAIAIIFLFTILSTIAGNVLFDIPPVLSFLTGLAVMFLVAHLYGEDTVNDPILDYVRQIEFDTLLFFLGILLLVGALKEIHALDTFVKLYEHLPAWSANYLMGLLSSLIDNVPLTAALLKADVSMNLAEWLSLTYAVGVGGSLLIIGSAAGIVAMSKIEALTFGTYLRYSLALLLAYSVGYIAVLGLGMAIS
ncbi:MULTISPECIES: sodium:proton antiporter NhaD [unclassified Oceanobacter]|uniref:sodium:proton antiporter NhaD n=1 Tax=unclassified Oceanobacter TaxID=2620260 RepID=UPI0027355D0A|nr:MULTISPECIES: sodium:proton antiporter NhaD [unclassified Oceanobacter]MDP2608884.1 sodium:proton antiporter NhaD [Oceanobacter sp. 1_MG-2023]MDP2611874.1 sodium:proton antiporter NhaD [Oceanobacter sp. 2_MG-2023]